MKTLKALVFLGITLLAVGGMFALSVAWIDGVIYAN